MSRSADAPWNLETQQASHLPEFTATAHRLLRAYQSGIGSQRSNHRFYILLFHALLLDLDQYRITFYDHGIGYRIEYAGLSQ